MRLFLRPLAGRHAPNIIPAESFLHDRAAFFINFDLTFDLILRSADKRAEAVEVFDLGARAELITSNGAHRNVCLKPQYTFFHVAGVHAEITQDRADFRGVIERGFNGANIGLGDDLKQRHACAIEIDQRIIFFVREFRCIFFDVNPPHSHFELILTAIIDIKRAFFCDRQFVLRDLIALGQVGVVIIFARKGVVLVDGAVQRETDQRGKFRRLFVDDRHGTRQSCADGADVAIGFRRGAIVCRAAAEHFGVGEQLAVNFKSDYGFVLGHG